MSKKKSKSTNQKKNYQVQAGETIEACLARIKNDGFKPVRRVEEPIFKEVTNNGKIAYEPVDRTIIFQVVPSEYER